MNNRRNCPFGQHVHCFQKFKIYKLFIIYFEEKLIVDTRTIKLNILN